jgi:hypothetical protein
MAGCFITRLSVAGKTVNYKKRQFLEPVLILSWKRCGLVCCPHEWQGAANVRRINKIQSGGPNNYGLARMCHPVLVVIAMVEPFENGQGNRGHENLVLQLTAGLILV